MTNLERTRCSSVVSKTIKTIHQFPPTNNRTHLIDRKICIYCWHVSIGAISWFKETRMAIVFFAWYNIFAGHIEVTCEMGLILSWFALWHSVLEFLYLFCRCHFNIRCFLMLPEALPKTILQYNLTQNWPSLAQMLSCTWCTLTLPNKECPIVWLLHKLFFCLLPGHTALKPPEI